MSFPNSSADQTPQEGKEAEVPPDSPRGRTKTPDHAYPKHHGHGKQPDSRSVSRGRTHRRSRHEDARGRDHPPPEDFVYPCPTGGFSPKGRPPTQAEAAYLSDAPHLDYKKPTQGKKRRSSGAVKSPQPSHIRMEMMEMEAWGEMARPHRGAPEKAKETKEESGKSEHN